MKQNDQRSFMRDLDKLISKMEVAPDWEEVIEANARHTVHDPEAAKKYFESMGAVVY